MPTIEESVVIDKPRAEVFAFFTDPESINVYSSNIVDYRVVSGADTEIGRHAKFAAKVAGIKLDYTDELTEYDEDTSYKLASVEGRIPYTIAMSFSDEGSGTKVTWHQETDSLGSVFKFADPIVVKMYSKDVRSNLEKAKTLLEG
jgi:carbon monoxide dehydrogenase subunit G